MKKPVRRSLRTCIGMSLSAAALTAGFVAVRHMLETPQPLKSTLPGEALLYIWRKRSIFYKVLGPVDAPPLVLLHTPDIGASAHEMQHIMEPLALTYRVYAPDLLGFGISDKPGIEYSAAMYGELCHDFVREVVKRPATLVASGLSCNYAVTLAAREPELCTGLVLISPLVLRGDPEQPQVLRNLAEKPWCKALLYPLLCTRLAFQLTQAPSNRQAEFAQFYATTHQLGAEHAAMALLAGKLVLDSTREFAALQQPILLIWGAQALEDQRNLASLHESSSLRRAREIELIQGAGLAVHEEQPESVVAAIRRWQAEARPQLSASSALPIPDPVAELHYTTSPAESARTSRVHAEPTRTTQTPSIATQRGEPMMPQEEPAVPREKLVIPREESVAPREEQFISREEPAARLEEPVILHEESVTPYEKPVHAATLSEPTQISPADHLPQSPGILAYCVKCKQKREVVNASEFTMKNGRPAIRGSCSVCGTTITRIGKLT